MKHLHTFESFLNEYSSNVRNEVKKLLKNTDLYGIINWNKDDKTGYVSAPADCEEIVSAVKTKYPNARVEKDKNGDNLLMFESAVRSTSKKISESEDFDGFMQALETAITSAGAHFYIDTEYDDYVFAISKNQLTPEAVEKMFDSGRPASGATMFTFENTLEEIEKDLKAAVKKMGLKVDLNSLFATYM